MNKGLWIGLSAVAAIVVGGLVFAWWWREHSVIALAPLDDAETYVLLSLDPIHEPISETRRAEILSGDTFHGFKVLGRTEIKDEQTRQKLNAALHKGVQESDGSVAACFWPRHGIIVSRGGITTEYVICFHCHSMQILQGQIHRNLPVTGSPEPVFDEVLAAAGVKLAEKEK